MADTVTMSGKCFTWTSIVVSCRLVAVASIVSACIYRHELDDFVQEVWQAMRANKVFQYESFEVRDDQTADALSLTLDPNPSVNQESPIPARMGRIPRVKR